MEAHSLKTIDECYRLAQLAIYTRRAQEFDPKTKIYKVQKASDLVDVEALEREIFGDLAIDEETYSRLMKIHKNLEEYRKGKEVDNGKTV